MDTSPEYIKMCEKAPRELRKNVIYGSFQCYCVKHKSFIMDGCDCDWICETGEELLDKYPAIGNKSHEDEKDKIRCNREEDWIILFTQDQLQGMYQGPFRQLEKTSPWGLCIVIKEFCSNNTDFQSMEQLWLAFIMKEKFLKAWNKEDWVNA